MTAAAERLPFTLSVRAGDLLFISGQASVDEDGALVAGTFAEQFHVSMENLRRILADSSLTFAHVVKVGAYVHHVEDLVEYNRLYREYFQEPRPARTTLTGCLTDQVLFEVDAIAYIPS